MAIRDNIRSPTPSEVGGARTTRQNDAGRHNDRIRVARWTAFHYTEDPAQSEKERHRVQLAMLFLIHAFSAARPCSSTNTNMRRTGGPTAGR